MLKRSTFFLMFAGTLICLSQFLAAGEGSRKRGKRPLKPRSILRSSGAKKSKRRFKKKRVGFSSPVVSDIKGELLLTLNYMLSTGQITQEELLRDWQWEEGRLALWKKILEQRESLIERPDLHEDTEDVSKPRSPGRIRKRALVTTHWQKVPRRGRLVGSKPASFGIVDAPDAEWIADGAEAQGLAAAGGLEAQVEAQVEDDELDEALEGIAEAVAQRVVVAERAALEAAEEAEREQLVRDATAAAAGEDTSAAGSARGMDLPDDVLDAVLDATELLDPTLSEVAGMGAADGAVREGDLDFGALGIDPDADLGGGGFFDSGNGL